MARFPSAQKIKPFTVAALLAVIVAGPVSAASFEGLGTLPAANGNSDLGSEARVISADGSTVAGVSRTYRGWEPFRWTETEGMVALGLPPGAGRLDACRYSDTYSSSDSDTAPSAISADGRVISGTVGRYGLEPFIWSNRNGKVEYRMPLLESVTCTWPSSGSPGWQGPKFKIRPHNAVLPLLGDRSSFPRVAPS